MCDKAVDTFPSTIKFVPECFLTQEICDKAADSYFCLFESIHDRAVSEDPFLIVYCPNRYINEKMCDEAADDSVGILKLIPDWFVRSKMVKKLFTALYADENILHFNEDPGNVLFSCNEMGILNIDLNNVSLDNNFDKNDSDTVINVRLLAWNIKFEKYKALKKRW